MTELQLHHSQVQARGAAPTRAVFFAHGILGSGSNLRGLAQRLVEREPDWLAVLVDLRGHGRSPNFTPPHTVEACAQDLCALEAALPWPVEGAVGHSFGGKVALAYHARRPGLKRLGLLDSAPFARPDAAGSEETLAVIELLARAPARFGDRAEFIAYVHEHGQSRAIADWLAMNLERVEGGFRLRTDLQLIRALLDDYFRRDLWDVLERSSARIDLVIGGRSRVWGPADQARARDLAAQRLFARAPEAALRPDGLRVHVLPDAGHWVHVDDPAGTAAALAR
jgi:esterase